MALNTTATIPNDPTKEEIALQGGLDLRNFRRGDIIRWANKHKLKGFDATMGKVYLDGRIQELHQQGKLTQAMLKDIPGGD